MLTMFFGMVEFSSGVAVNRKVTLVARNDVRPDSQSLDRHRHRSRQFHDDRQGDHDAVSVGAPLNTTVTELYVDPTTLTAKVKWSKGSAPRGVGTTVAIPTALKIGGTYLIYAEVDYIYMPAVGYVMARPASRSATSPIRVRASRSACSTAPTVCPT